VRVESRVLVAYGLAVALLAAIYWFTSYEDAGTTMLAAGGLFGLLAGGYLFVQSRRIAPRPEDRVDAAIAEGAGPVSEFPATSIWPFALAFGATVLATGFVFGVWVILLGGSLFALAAAGYVAESRRAR
jgi:hypothetical protein